MSNLYYKVYLIIGLFFLIENCLTWDDDNCDDTDVGFCDKSGCGENCDKILDAGAGLLCVSWLTDAGDGGSCGRGWKQQNINTY